MDTIRLWIFEFLAFPAHIWIWLCAKLVGGEFYLGPATDVEEAEDEK